MQLVKFSLPSGVHAGVLIDETIHYYSESSLSPIGDFLEAPDFVAKLKETVSQADVSVSLGDVTLLAPIDQQEVWAAGVTYKRSKSARMEESEAAASCYDRVYQSPRPEIFFKSTPHRVVGHGENIRIRSDSEWNVPEPEITLVINSRKEFIGFTVGNDMSSRDIEGDNPLYLPQAKMYDQCCGLGPGIVPRSVLTDKELMLVNLSITRNSEEVFTGETSAAEMAREFDELLQWLGRDNSFPNGAFLLTGTGIVPDSDFTLRPGDQISISITGIGTLNNTVVQT